MDKNSVKWQGPFTAIVTPFDRQGRIDESAFAHNVEGLIRAGATGIVANGCTGEFWAQNTDERKRLLEVAVKAAKGRITVIGGTGAITTSEAIEITQAAKDVGCDGAMIIPPFFVKPSTDDVIAHYETIARAVNIPIMLYNLPSQTFALTPEIVVRLAEIDNVVAIKDSSFDYNNFYRMNQLSGDRIRIFIGPSTMFGYPALKMGAVGWVDTYSNIWPELTVRLYNETMAGNDAKAQEIQKLGQEFRAFCDAQGNMYATTKAAMTLRGFSGGYPRLPLRPVSDAKIAEMRKGLERLGVPLTRAAAE